MNLLLREKEFLREKIYIYYRALRSAFNFLPFQIYFRFENKMYPSPGTLMSLILKLLDELMCIKRYFIQKAFFCRHFQFKSSYFNNGLRMPRYARKHLKN